MIKNVLVPEKVGNYYIFSKRIVGFDIDKTNVTATQLYLKGNTITIERCINETLELGKELTHDEKVVKAIKNIFDELGKVDTIYTAIPSSQVIFKSLKFPFTSRNKIKMVLNYEVEPLLPFSLKDAVVDFIVTSTNIEENSSEVLVAAVQNTYISQQITLFEQAGVTPEKVFVDLFSLYSLYTEIPEYKDVEGGVALIDIGFSDTRIAYIYNGRLSFIRTLPHGIFALAKKLATAYNVTQPEAVEMLMRFGIDKEDDPDYTNAAREVFSTFWSDIKFTLQSFASQLDEKSAVSKILLLGQGSNIPGVAEFGEKTLHISCQLFKTDSLIAENIIRVKNALSIPRNNILSLAIALPSPITDDFNLFKAGLGAADTSLFNKQIITAFILSLIIIIILIVHSGIQVGALKREIRESEKEAIDEIKEKIKIPTEEEADEGEETLQEVIEEANTAVTKEESVWSAFSPARRTSMLKYWLALTDAVPDDLEIFFKYIKIVPTERKMIIKAEVKNIAALRKFEKSLSKSNLLKDFEPQQKADFTMEIKLSK